MISKELIKNEYKIWIVYFATILVSVYVHEVGHCIPAWVNGYWAIPTPAKEYMSDLISLDLKQYVSLGGIVGTVIFSLIVLFFFLTKPHRFSSPLLAGAMATPGFYTVRFIISGRGHDATEFQEAQSALGLSYAGHSLDWFFLLLLLVGTCLWIVKSKPGYRIIGRLSIGFVLTLIFVVGLQVINNAIFDPIFQSR